MRTIQDELGDNPQTQDVQDFKDRAEKKKWNTVIEKLFKKELEKMQRMNPQGAEYTVQMNYLDLLLDLPWGEYTKDNKKHIQGFIQFTAKKRLEQIKKLLDDNTVHLEMMKGNLKNSLRTRI